MCPYNIKIPPVITYICVWDVVNTSYASLRTLPVWETSQIQSLVESETTENFGEIRGCDHTLNPKVNPRWGIFPTQIMNRIGPLQRPVG